jgi:hypothetical protein
MLKNFLKRFEWGSLSIILAFSFVFFSGCSSSDNTKYVYLPEETTGAIVGTAFRCIDEVGENMLACRGIPYAESPVEDLRFAPPEPANLSGIIDATKFGSECPQWSGDNPMGNEDCLTLNIFVPKDPSEIETGYPVMVWFHGGAFIQGSGSVPAYDMPDLVKRGLIVVTVNYRLGALGFLSLPARIQQNLDGLLLHLQQLEPVGAAVGLHAYICLLVYRHGCAHTPSLRHACTPGAGYHVRCLPFIRDTVRFRPRAGTCRGNRESDRLV